MNWATEYWKTKLILFAKLKAKPFKYFVNKNIVKCLRPQYQPTQDTDIKTPNTLTSSKKIMVSVEKIETTYKMNGWPHKGNFSWNKHLIYCDLFNIKSCLKGEKFFYVETQGYGSK